MGRIQNSVILNYLGKIQNKKDTGFEIIHYLHLVHLHVLQENKTKYFGEKYHSPPQNFLFHMCVQRGTKLKSKSKSKRKKKAYYCKYNISSPGTYRPIKQLGPEKSKGYQKVCKATIHAVNPTKKENERIGTERRQAFNTPYVNQVINLLHD